MYHIPRHEHNHIRRRSSEAASLCLLLHNKDKRSFEITIPVDKMSTSASGLRLLPLGATPTIAAVLRRQDKSFCCNSDLARFGIAGSPRLVEDMHGENNHRSCSEFCCSDQL